MIQLPKDSRELLALFHSTGVECVVVGAHALAWHVRPRFTGDLDLLVRPSEENAAKIMGALDMFGFGQTGISATDFMREGQIIQLGVAPNRIGLLTSIDGLTFDEVWNGSVEGLLSGVVVRVIGVDELRRNKETVGRPQDLADLDDLSR